MRCPFCNHQDTSVKDSRTIDDNSSIRRRRICDECGSRFTTFERVQLRDLVVVKKDGTRVPFSRDKLANSITSAIHKRNLDPDRVERLLSSLVRQLEVNGEQEFTTQRIGELVMQSLFYLDPVAYVRFASVYQDFSNVEDFIRFVKRLEEENLSTNS